MYRSLSARWISTFSYALWTSQCRSSYFTSLSRGMLLWHIVATLKSCSWCVAEDGFLPIYLHINSLWGGMRIILHLLSQQRGKNARMLILSITSKRKAPRTIAVGTVVGINLNFPLTCLCGDSSRLRVLQLIFIAALGKVTLSQPISARSDSERLQRARSGDTGARVRSASISAALWFFCLINKCDRVGGVRGIRWCWGSCWII